MLSRIRYGNEAVIAASLKDIDPTTTEILKKAGRVVLRFSGSLESLPATDDFAKLMDRYSVDWDDPQIEGGPKYIVINSPEIFTAIKIHLFAQELIHLASRQETVNPDGTQFVDYSYLPQGQILAEI